MCVAVEGGEGACWPTVVGVVAGVDVAVVAVVTDVVVGPGDAGGAGGAGAAVPGGGSVAPGGEPATVDVFALFCALGSFASLFSTAVLMMSTRPTTPAASETPRNAALM